MLSFNVSEESRDGMPIGWEVTGDGGELLGTVYDCGASNSVEINFIKPFPVQFLGNSIKGPADYTQPFQSTELKVNSSDIGDYLVVLSEWQDCDMNFSTSNERVSA